MATYGRYLLAMAKRGGGAGYLHFDLRAVFFLDTSTGLYCQAFNENSPSPPSWQPATSKFTPEVCARTYAWCRGEGVIKSWCQLEVGREHSRIRRKYRYLQKPWEERILARDKRKIKEKNHLVPQ